MESSTMVARRDALERASTALIVLAAFASFLLSVGLWFTGSELEGIFVGIWVPSILSFGAFVRGERSTR